MKKLLWIFSALMTLHLTATAATTNTAANAINSLGLDLLRQTKPDQNTVLSPYSIQSAMAMAYEGADGTTRTEMAHVLHYPDGDQIRESLNSLRHTFDEIATNSQAHVQSQKQQGHGASDPLVLTTANRLFGQTGYDFRAPFLSLLKNVYQAPLQDLDFINQAAAAAKQINQWVEKQTHDRIRDIVPSSGLPSKTRLVVVNAIYLKAPWQNPFEKSATQPKPFYLANEKTIAVPTMTEKKRFSYGEFADFITIALPYNPANLQLLILLPKRTDGLASLEKNLKPDTLSQCAAMPTRELTIYLPKFKLHPPLFRLKNQFEKLGMREAFDIPEGSANFDKIAPRTSDDYLYISDIFHKTFVDVDEKGTEAAAATAIVMMQATGAMRPPKQPLEVHVDHPFLFAIQHRETGVCLFLGRVTDPSAN